MRCVKPRHAESAEPGQKLNNQRFTASLIDRKEIRQPRKQCVAKARQQTDVEKPNPGLGLKAIWVGAENFGKLIGQGQKREEEGQEKPLKKMTRKEVIKSIKDDYDRNYFVSGAGEMEAYDPQCLFADPFAGFQGVERFKQNVSNLGGLTEDIDLKILEFNERDNEVETKWRFSAVLQLPWRPRLAAAGGTRHVIDPDSGLVVKHLESWDSEPGKVIKSLLRPANPKAETKPELFMLALSQGDAKNMWLSASDVALKISLPIVAISLLTKAATGHGLPGLFLGGLEGLSFLVAISAALTEAFKAVQQPKK